MTALLLVLGMLSMAGCTVAGPTSVAATPLPVSIGTISLPNGTVGTAYSAAILADNGTSPYSFSLTSGALPAGLTLAGNGVVLGTPTASGTATFAVKVTDAVGETASATLSLTVNAASVTPVAIVTNSLPGGTVGVGYTGTVLAAYGTTPYSFSVTSGALPAGLSLATTGAITGSPTAATTASFTVTVTDVGGKTATANLSIAIAAVATPVSITTLTLPGGTVGAAYSATIAAANGTMPYSFALSQGGLPGGLTLGANGVLAGTPTGATTQNFSVTVTDHNGGTATQSYTLTIAAAGSPPAITTTTLPGGAVGTPYNAVVLAANGTAPYSFSVASGALPAGVVLGTTGGLTGSPTTAGPVTFTIAVTDANGKSASQGYSLTIAAAGTGLTIAPASLPAGTEGTFYTATFTAAGGTAPYAFSVTGGQLPAGMTFTAGGVLAGTPITSATSYFTVTATDAASNVASQNYSVTMNYAGAPTVSITTTVLPNAVLNTNYTTHVVATGGTAPYTMTLIGGALPVGLTLASNGAITGVVTHTATSYFTVQATDSSSPAQSTQANLEIMSSNYSATVVVDPTHVLATVPQGFFGVHTSVYDPSLDDTGALPTLLTGTGIQTLRYPGGGYSDNYHWSNFSITPYFSSTAPACSVQADGYLASDGDFGTFVRLVRSSGAQALITVNYGTSVADALGSKTVGTDGQKTCSEPNTWGQPQEAAAWVAYANGSATSTQTIGKDATGFDWKTVGYWASLRAASPLSTDDGYNFLRLGVTTPVGIKYWEIGNEMYYNGWATNHNAETDDHAPYVYPNGYTPGGYNSRAALDALSPTAYGTNAIQWIEAMKAVDPTIEIGVDFSSPISTDPIPTNWNPDLAAAVCAGAPIDFAIMHYYPGTYLNVQASELLSRPQVDIPNVVGDIQAALASGCVATAATTKIFLTETSPNGPLAAGFPTQALGLFAIDDFLTSLKTGIGNIDWLELHDGSYLTTAEAPGPAYYGIEMAHLLASPGDSVLSTYTSSATVLTWSTTKTTGHHGLLLVNADPDNPAIVEVTLGSAVNGSASEYSYGVGITPSGPTLSGTPVTLNGSGTFPVTIPAYTAVELDIL
jgi:hypothetical protein